ncbi:MAG: Hsp70 family protein [Planctomycetes bacterium]|nr:Hsp70 family protein [Planctomycetota bacterium]
MIIGIDLGTTNSVAAVMREGTPVLIPNALGESLTPSVVGIDREGDLLVGRAAVELQVLHPERCASVFIKTLAARVLETQGMMFERAELEAPALVSRVMQQCEKVKKLLSRQEKAEVVVPDREGNFHESSPKVEITRDQFTQWTQHILARIELPIRRGLGDANLKRADVNEVILVGGATRMPAVIQAVTQIFGKSPHSRLNPDEVVALGAAVQAGLIAREQSLDAAA